MSDLLDQIAETEAKLAQLKRQAAAAPCAEAGHRWKHLGGASAGCGEGCGCSVPVHECEVCGDCDYGDTPWREKTITACRERRGDDTDDGLGPYLFS